jgi:hypothetical protein
MPENVYMDGRTYDRRDAGYMGYDYNPTDWTDPRTQESQSLFNGQSFDEYGKDGSFSNSGVFTGIEDRNKYGDMIGALSILAMPFAAAGLGAGAAGAAGAGAGAGAGGMVNGAFLGEGIASGIGAWDGAMAAAGAGAGGAGAAGAAGGGGGIGGGVGNGAFLGEGVASGVPAWDAAATAAGSGGGLLSSLGGAKNLLGIGSTLLGAAAGAKGQDASSTTSKDIPEWLKPYITGNNGLLSQTQQQLTASRSPERMAQWDQMRNVGMGLLNQPIAGNPTTGWTFPR